MSNQTREHPEWTKENSLTCPEDRDRNVRWRPEQSEPSLTNTEVDEAMKELNNISFTEKFPKVDRTYADPPPPMQKIGLISFTPAKGAVPNNNGVYGFAKLRGNFQTTLEADQRAEFLIRHVDSYHQIYHTYVGRPFPITVSSKYSEETDEIDIRKEMTKSISSDVRAKKKKEQSDIEEIKDRERKLLEESKISPEDADPYEEYITLRVKKAQLSWTYLEHQKKLKEIKGIIIKTRARLEEMEEENSEFREKYYDKYMKARTDAGLKDDSKTEESFMRFLVEDAILPGIDDVENDNQDLHLVPNPYETK